MESIEGPKELPPPAKSAPGEMPKLNETQLKYFDTEYVSPEMWRLTERWIANSFPDGRFSFLDVGGGNGAFTDSLLSRFPRATGVLIDNGEALLARNKPHPRKTLLCQSAIEMDRRFSGRSFDLICLNWLLHHLVLRSYIETCRLQARVVAAARDLLSARGRICVFENLYDGMIIDALPSHLIFQLTSSHVLSPIIKRLGANTAGCGVCFRSRTQWEQLFREAKLEMKHVQVYGQHPIGKAKKIALHIRSAHIAAFWLAQPRASSLHSIR